MFLKSTVKNVPIIGWFTWGAGTENVLSAYFFKMSLTRNKNIWIVLIPSQKYHKDLTLNYENLISYNQSLKTKSTSEKMNVYNQIALQETKRFLQHKWQNCPSMYAASSTFRWT